MDKFLVILVVLLLSLFVHAFFDSNAVAKQYERDMEKLFKAK